jgi:hypothetical protein
MWLSLIFVSFGLLASCHRHNYHSSSGMGVRRAAPSSTNCRGGTGLKLIRNFNNTVNDDEWPPGRSFGPPPTDMIGGGDLEIIMNVAADYWEQVFPHVSPPWTLQIDYGWTNGGSIDTLYGEVRLITQGGSKDSSRNFCS